MSKLIVGYPVGGIRISGPTECLERALSIVEDRLPGVQWTRTAADQGMVTVEATVTATRSELIATILEEWAKEVAGKAYSVVQSRGYTYFKGLPQR